MNWGIPIGQRRERTFHLKRKSGFQKFNTLYSINFTYVKTIKMFSVSHVPHQSAMNRKFSIEP